MTIKVGDRVRHVAGGQEGDVLAIAGDEAAVLVGGGAGIWVHQLSSLTPITPTPEPAPAPLTGAQVAQVLEAVLEVWAAHASSGGRFDDALRRGIRRERERVVAWLRGDENGRGLVEFRDCWNIAAMIERGDHWPKGADDVRA